MSPQRPADSGAEYSRRHAIFMWEVVNVSS